MSAPCFCRHFRGTSTLISVALCVVCRTALHVAGNSGSVEHLRVLMSAGAAIEAQSAKGRTPVFNAAWQGHLDAVKLLHEHGVNHDGCYQEFFGHLCSYE